MSKHKQLDPAVERFLRDLRADKNPPLPANVTFAEIVAAAVDHPGLLPDDVYKRASRVYRYMESIMLVPQQIKDLVAERLDNPRLNDKDYLSVELEDDWRVNAEVEQDPPYHVYVSTGLYRFCVKLSELLIGGLGLITADESSGETAENSPHWSIAEITDKVKSVLDRFIQDHTIPEEEMVLPTSHTGLIDVTFYSILASIVGHEFGHVVINEERRGGRTQTAKPYAEFAERLLRSNAQNLLYTPIDDPDDRGGLGKLNQGQIRQVAARWVDELTADLIGIDIARKYHQEFGPRKAIPGVVAYVNTGIHLGFMAQLFLHLYLHRHDPKFSLTSPTHPPIRFRMHCAVIWMYADPQDPSVMTLINYCQKLIDAVLPYHAGSSTKHGAP